MLPNLFHEKGLFPFHVVERDPAIVTTYWNYDLAPLLRIATSVVAPSPLHLFALLAWTYENEDQRLRAVEQYTRCRAQFPGVELTLVCNTPKEMEILGGSGLPTLFCNANAFLDERIFDVDESVPRVFDAVYNARMDPLKRHWLAAGVERLGLVTYVDDDYEATPEFPTAQAYYEYVRKTLPGAVLLNPHRADDVRSIVVFDAPTVARQLQRARVGLCLSAVEGAMLASTEYLLCGLPVVSTRSIGGRDVFFQDGYAAVVEDRPEAVRRAVAALIAARASSARVRRETLEIVRSHRERFTAAVDRIYARHGKTVRPEGGWRTSFVNKMVAWQPLDRLRTLLAR